jgi:hypothetical protein
VRVDAVINPADAAFVRYALGALHRNTATRHLRIALNAWGGQVRNMARTLAPRDTGLLSRAQAVKVRIPDASFDVRHHGKPAYVVVGTDRRAVQHYLAGTRKKLSTRTPRGVRLGLRWSALQKAQAGRQNIDIRKPSRYAHLANKRSQFMRTAEALGRTAGALAFVRKMYDGYVREAARLAASQH